MASFRTMIIAAALAVFGWAASVPVAQAGDMGFQGDGRVQLVRDGRGAGSFHRHRGHDRYDRAERRYGGRHERGIWRYGRPDRFDRDRRHFRGDGRWNHRRDGSRYDRRDDDAYGRRNARGDDRQYDDRQYDNSRDDGGYGGSARPRDARGYDLRPDRNRGRYDRQQILRNRRAVSEYRF